MRVANVNWRIFKLKGFVWWKMNNRIRDTAALENSKAANGGRALPIINAVVWASKQTLNLKSSLFYIYSLLHVPLFIAYRRELHKYHLCPFKFITATHSLVTIITIIVNAENIKTICNLKHLLDFGFFENTQDSSFTLEQQI
jgi:hypothetical protein